MTDDFYSRKYRYPVGAKVRINVHGRIVDGVITKIGGPYSFWIWDTFYPGSMVTEVLSNPDDDFDFGEEPTE